MGLSLPLDDSLAIDPQSVSAETDIGVTFSVDGGESFEAFETLSVEDGGTTRQAQATDLTHMRIEIAEVGAESTIAVSYDAVVR